MQTRLAAWLTVGLLVVNTAAVSWLVRVALVRGEDSSPAALTDTHVAQMDKLFKIMTDFHQELVTVTGQAAYEDEKEKTDGKIFLEASTLAYSLSRIDYEAARKSRRVRDLQSFVVGAACGRGSLGLPTMNVPQFQRYVAATYDRLREVKPSTTFNYANVSRLESLQEQFKVLAASLLEDLK